MNIHETGFLPDVQAQPDPRNIALDAVGIRGLRYPLRIAAPDGDHPTIGVWAMNVALPPAVKGTHMSRFVELLEARAGRLDHRAFERVVREMLQRLDAQSGEVILDFTYFHRKEAPVSGARSWLDCDVRWHGKISRDGRYVFRCGVTVPTTSLCPCSKEISAHGAHNQRSHIAIEVASGGAVEIQDVIAMAERAASCELFALLKRPDEKYVTEQAYEQPRFVEDLVREVAKLLDADPRVQAYRVEAENFESIHNHSAVARVEKAER